MLSKITTCLLLFCFWGLNTAAQQLIIEHDPKTPEPSVLEEGRYKVILVNNTNSPIYYFYSHHYKSGGCELTTEKTLDGEMIKTTTSFKPDDTNSRFNSKAFVTIPPKQEKWITSLLLNERHPGTYLLKVKIQQDPATVDLRYAVNTAVAAKAQQLTKLDLEAVYEHTIAAPKKKPFVAQELSYEELMKQPFQKDLILAEYDPSAYFALDLTIDDETDIPAAFAKIATLTNLRRLLINVNTRQPVAVPASVGALPLVEFSLTNRRKPYTAVTLPADLLTGGQLRTVLIEGVDQQDLTFLGKHAGMERLTLRNCELGSIDWIGALDQLSHLEISKTQLQTLPVAFQSLRRLEVLDLKQNQLNAVQYLPISPTLTSINLSQNQLSAIGESFGALVALTWIDLSANNLRELPASFAQLDQVTRLNIGKNKFSTLPKAVLGMKGLKQLVVNSNQLTTVPRDLRRLEQLQQLDLRENQIEVLPEEFFQLPLRRISLRKNPLQKKQERMLKKTFANKVSF